MATRPLEGALLGRVAHAGFRPLLVEGRKGELDQTSMQRLKLQLWVVIWPFKGSAEDLVITVMLAFCTSAFWATWLFMPAKAPADRNMAARVADSARVFSVFFMMLSRWWDNR